MFHIPLTTYRRWEYPIENYDEIAENVDQYLERSYDTTAEYIDNYKQYQNAIKHNHEISQMQNEIHTVLEQAYHKESTNHKILVGSMPDKQPSDADAFLAAITPVPDKLNRLIEKNIQYRLTILTYTRLNADFDIDYILLAQKIKRDNTVNNVLPLSNLYCNTLDEQERKLDDYKNMLIQITSNTFFHNGYSIIMNAIDDYRILSDTLKQYPYLNPDAQIASVTDALRQTSIADFPMAVKYLQDYDPNLFQSHFTFVTLNKYQPSKDRYGKLYAKGIWLEPNKDPKEIKFNRTFGNHKFNDNECALLLAGYPITIPDYKTKDGNTMLITGMLKEQNYHGSTFVGFTFT